MEICEEAWQQDAEDRCMTCGNCRVKLVRCFATKRWLCEKCHAKPIHPDEPYDTEQEDEADEQADEADEQEDEAATDTANP